MSTFDNRVPCELIATATIPAAAGASDVISLGPQSLVAIETPNALVSTSFTLTGCNTSDGTFKEIRDYAGNLLTITVSTNDFVILPPYPFGLLPRFIKLVTAATETTAKTVSIYARPIL